MRSDSDQCWPILLLKHGFKAVVTWLMLGPASLAVLFFVFLVSCFGKSLITRGIAHSCGFSVFHALVAQLPSTKRSALELYLMGEKWFVCVPCQSG